MMIHDRSWSRDLITVAQIRADSRMHSIEPVIVAKVNPNSFEPFLRDQQQINVY